MKELLTEKYRPSSIDGYIFPNEEAERKVKKWIKEKEIPNVLMASGAGMGKTTMARILINELGVSGTDVKVVKASLTNGIGFIRDELEPWIKKASFGNFKIVHLEEADRLSQAAQDALRIVTEEYSDVVRFIATCNYPKRLTPAFLSRFQVVDMNGITEDQIIELVLDVIEKEDIFLYNDDESIIIEHIQKYAPDIRKILNSIDECCEPDSGNGFKTLYPPTNSVGSSTDSDAWFDAWSADELDPVKLLELTEMVDNTNFDNFYSVMYTNITKHAEDVANAVITISKYLDRAQTTANQRLTLDACIYELFFVSE